MGFLSGPKRAKTRYLIEVPHDAAGRRRVIDGTAGHGPAVCPFGGVCYTAPPWSAWCDVRAGEP
jgi:hypothetical protein